MKIKLGTETSFEILKIAGFRQKDPIDEDLFTRYYEIMRSRYGYIMPDKDDLLARLAHTTSAEARFPEMIFGLHYPGEGFSAALAGRFIPVEHERRSTTGVVLLERSAHVSSGGIYLNILREVLVNEFKRVFKRRKHVHIYNDREVVAEVVEADEVQVDRFRRYQGFKEAPELVYQEPPSYDGNGNITEEGFERTLMVSFTDGIPRDHIARVDLWSIIHGLYNLRRPTSDDLTDGDRRKVDAYFAERIDAIKHSIEPSSGPLVKLI